MRRAVVILVPLLAMPAMTILAQSNWQDQMSAELKKEKVVRSSKWNDDSTLIVGVVDDGSKRDGLAEYLCLLSANTNKPEEHRFSILVVDHKTFRSGDSKKLGAAKCG